MKRLAKSFFIFFALTFFISNAALAQPAPDSFADLAEKLLPSVVNISTKQTVVQDEMMDLQFPPGSPFEDFFRDYPGRRMLPQQPMEREKSKRHKVMSLGSGFIIDKSGYIVTNLHVIQDAEEISVILQDDTNLKAKLVGKDKKTDLAVLKVETKKELPALKFGNSDNVRVGDWIVAIGNPFGLGGTVTAGIISARARDINSGPYDDYLQTDAPINRGNSGGPMFNMKGEVIGINTAIFSPSGGSVGIGFAIPASIADNVVTQLIKHGSTKRGWLGVHIQEITEDIAASLGMKKPNGALISNVTEDGPAKKAGFKSGDVIVEFDGKKISQMQRLPRIVADTPIDKTVDVKVLRKGKLKTLKVKLGELDQDEDNEEEISKPTNVKKQSYNVPDLGLNVTPLTNKLRKKYELSKDVKGLLITLVNDEGLAAEYGLQEGDLISQAAQSDLNKAEQLASIAKIHKKKQKPLLLLVNRRGDLRFIALPFEE